MRLSESEFEAYLTPVERQRVETDANLRCEIFEHLESMEIGDFDESAYPLDESLKNVLVFANLPRVGEAKFGKLLRFLEKVTSKFGSAEVTMPVDDSNTSFGVAIVTFQRISEALKAHRDLQDFELDAEHRLKIFPFDQAAELLTASAEAEASASATAASSSSTAVGDRSTLADFMQDERYREELLVRFQAETQICWWDSLDAAEPLQLQYGGERAISGAGAAKKAWCEGNAFFSPRGSFVVTVHPGRGVQLWGGRDFERKARFLHSHVSGVLIAPDEEHVLLLGSDSDDPEAVKLFRVLTGELVRVFPGTHASSSHSSGSSCGFAWSASGQYLGKIVEKTLFVYGAADAFRPLLEGGSGGKTLFTARYVNCVDFVFCGDSQLAVWTSEGANVPARLAILDLERRREVASKTFFSTEGEGVLHWNGKDGLTLRTARLLKKAGATKKIGYAVDLFLFGQGGAVQSFSVDLGAEGTGLRQAVAIPDGSGRVAVLQEKLLVVYRGEREKGTLVEQSRLNLAAVGGSGGGCSFEKVEISQFGYAVVYGPSGDLVFTSLANPAGTAEFLRVDQHYLVNRVQFDPSGRFVLTAVVQKMHDDSSMAFRYQQEAGFAIWTFQGRPLHKWKKEKLFNVQWRPHAASLLAAEEKKKILAELKLREKKIEEEEEAIKGLSRDSVQKSIADKKNSFYAVLAQVDNAFAARK